MAIVMTMNMVMTMAFGNNDDDDDDNKNDDENDDTGGLEDGEVWLA